MLLYLNDDGTAPSQEYDHIDKFIDSTENSPHKKRSNKFLYFETDLIVGDDECILTI
jgi:hypothetical protein